MSTALLNSGSIDFQVETVWNDALFSELEAAGQASLPPACREDLKQLAFSWIERRSMARAAYRPVRAMLEQLRTAAAKNRTEKFLALLPDYANSANAGCPNAAYVHDLLSYELRIVFEPSWRDEVLSGQRCLHSLGETIKTLRDNLDHHYGGKKGGTRDHDLGWVLYRLANIYRSAGGKISASTKADFSSSAFSLPHVTDSNFIRFAKVFIHHLPSRPLVDVGNLIKRALPVLKCHQQ